MKQEFVTLYGQAIIERDTLFLRSLYLPFEKTPLAQIGIELIWLTVFVSRLFSLDTSMRMIIAIVWGLLIASRIPTMYDKFFKRSYATRIPLSSIERITKKKDAHGLETELRLHLKSGRYKSIVFRNLEKQLEPFISALPVTENRIESTAFSHS